MPVLQFACNLSWLFPTLPSLPSRMQVAAAAGFRWVEIAWPYEWAPEVLKKEADRFHLKVVLINTPQGDQEKGEMGLGAVPGRQEEFRKGLDLAVQYAKVFKCERIHIMAGRVPVGMERAAVATQMEDTFIENLKYAANLLAEEKMIGLLEPINSRITEPRYFLNSPHHAAAILKKVGHPHLMLQMDVFHWQIMDGNLTQNIKTYLPLIGHIQVAQVPGRNEPDSPGEINFTYLFQLLEDLDYKGYVGCEYTPKGDTVEGLSWLRSYWGQLGRQADNLLSLHHMLPAK